MSADNERFMPDTNLLDNATGARHDVGPDHPKTLSR
jgi:hypothetical protein